MDYFLDVLGLALVIEGLPYLISPERMKRLFVRMQGMPPAFFRAMGMGAVFVGIILIYLLGPNPR